MKKSDAPILIAGGGIGGLATALALLRRGIDVTVIEQASELREVGAGLQISANGTRVLFDLGLEKQIDRIASVPTGKQIRLWNTGQSWKLFDLGAESVAQYGFPYVMLHRADLLAVLGEAVSAIKPDAIKLGHKVASLEQGQESVRLQCEDGASFSGQGLIGADGVHSVIRRELFGPDKARFTGCMAWRALIPGDGLPKSLRERVGTNWVGPGRHVVHYPLRDGEIINFVGIVERDDWTVESWSERGSTEECSRDFVGWHDEIQQLIARSDRPNKWALMGRDPLPTWTRGRATLLGDACHPTLPFLAQGAVMAIEDAMVLARCLERYRGDVSTGMQRYEELRKERTSTIVRGSADNAKRFHSDSLSTQSEAQAYIDKEWSEDQIRRRYSWLFEYDALSVPIEREAFVAAK